jgi:formylglycine-generating enzyme required for sulfatase activity
MAVSSSFYAEVTVTNVLLRQRWPWSRMIDITYDVQSPDGIGGDVHFELIGNGNPLTIPQDAVTGNLFDVSGSGRITIDPTKTPYAAAETMTVRARVTATRALPLYVVYDLTKTPGQDGQVEYVYSNDPRLESYGRFDKVWFGVTNGLTYKTTKLVMRRCSAGSVHVGFNGEISSPEVPPNDGLVTYGEPFYMSVFELTEGQYSRIVGASASDSDRPKDYISYQQCRGIKTGSDGSGVDINWPVSGDVVGYENTSSPGTWNKSLCLQLRDLTGEQTFDIPTEGQWEYGCRAGTETYFNSGIKRESVTYASEIITELAWMQYYSQWQQERVQKVGLLKPNNWGIYDMHGNVFEMCRDVWSSNYPDGTNPTGPNGNPTSDRIRRGGNFGCTAVQVTSGSRLSWSATRADAEGLGVRLVMQFQYPD